MISEGETAEANTYPCVAGTSEEFVVCKNYELPALYIARNSQSYGLYFRCVGVSVWEKKASGCLASPNSYCETAPIKNLRHL